MKRDDLGTLTFLANQLERIRMIGYNSEAHRATNAVLAIIRVSEEALEYARTKGITAQ